MKHTIDVVPATRPFQKLPVRSFRKSGIDRTGVALAQQSAKVLTIGVGQKANQAVFKFQRCAVVEFSQTPKRGGQRDRKSTRLNSSHLVISYAVFCLKKKK